jgi:hypothetical protein
MKAKDVRLFPETMEILFDFFEKYSIKPNSFYTPIQDRDRLLELILEGSVEDYYIHETTGLYGLDYKPIQYIDRVHLYLFGSHSFLIEQSENAIERIGFDIHGRSKLPPFYKDLMDRDGFSAESGSCGLESKCYNDKDLMTLDEFRKFLEKNNTKGKLIGIEVE